MRTLSAPNCPKVYSAIATSTPPEENGITGFVVAGRTASADMLQREPLWSILSGHGVTVGMANVPATFPAMPLNGYMISGHAYPWQRLRGRDSMFAEAVGGERGSGGVSAEHGC